MDGGDGTTVYTLTYKLADENANGPKVYRQRNLLLLQLHLHIMDLVQIVLQPRKLKSL